MTWPPNNAQIEKITAVMHKSKKNSSSTALQSTVERVLDKTFEDSKIQPDIVLFFFEVGGAELLFCWIFLTFVYVFDHLGLYFFLLSGHSHKQKIE